MKMIIAITLLGSCAMATIKPYKGAQTKDNPDYREMYLANGTAVAPNQAFTSALQGQEVYKCVLQEVSMGKTGMNAGLHNTKKRQ